MVRCLGSGSVLGLLLALAMGCAISPIQNVPLEQYSPDAGYRLKNVPAGEDNSDSLFVILTFSGGGTRAAAFAYGALEKLRDTEIEWEGERRRLLDEVDIISSVSGGSLTAAYYGLFGDRIFEDFRDNVLYQDIQAWIIRNIFSMSNRVRLASPLYTRTDLTAEGFDEKFFEGKTFADLLARGQRPYLLINATDMSLGHRFEFTQDQFDFLYSDLAPFHVAWAVTASAAFPGAFPPMTLENHEQGGDYQLPAWVEEGMAVKDLGSLQRLRAESFHSYVEPGRPYVHLIDGGVADNLGLLPVGQALRRILYGEEGEEGEGGGRVREHIKKVLVVTVNAKVQPDTDWDQRYKPIRLFSVLTSAGTTPMSNFSFAQVEYVKLLVKFLEETEDEKAFRGLPQRPDFHFVEMSFDYVEDEEQREALNALPTSFRLSLDDVDMLRRHAGEILDEHPAFTRFLGSLPKDEDE